jgi:hypothetical protein
MHLYLGGNFTYFTGDAAISAILIEGQVGYDLAVIRAAPVLIRPYGGLGYEHVSLAVPAVCGAVPGCGGDGGGAFVLSLGTVGTYFFTPHWFAGVDIRLDIGLAAYSGTVLNFSAIGGYKF